MTFSVAFQLTVISFWLPAFFLAASLAASVIELIKFANGGDRNDKTTPETTFCEQNNIIPIWGVGGNNKSNSSSWILKKWNER